MPDLRKRISQIFKRNEFAQEIPIANGINHVPPPVPTGYLNGNLERAPQAPLRNGNTGRTPRAQIPIRNYEQTPPAQFTIRNRLARRPAVQPIIEHDNKPEVPSGDIVAHRDIKQLVKKEELRELGELIRERYKLDMLLYNLRNKTSYEDDVIEENVIKASAALAKIKRLVNSFDRHDLFADPEDFKKLREIKMRIYQGGKRDWEKHPPSMDKGYQRDYERRFERDILTPFDRDDEL